MSNELINLMKTKMLLGMNDKGLDKNSFTRLLLLQAFDAFIKKSPELGYRFMEWYKKRFDTVQIFEKDEPKIKASILLEKCFNDDKQEPYNKIIESIIHYITTVSFVKTLLFNGHQLLPNFTDPIPLNNHIYFELKNLDRDEKGKLEKISFKLFTYDKDIDYLKEFLYESEKTYNITIQNKLGTSLYFFDQHIIKVSGNRALGQRAMPSLPFLIYSKHKFTTNRTFDNIFFEQKNNVMERLDFFMNNREWYDQKGIPYTLGFLFYGVPGCGKTSTIKAIANVSKRHIININLAEVRTKKQLKHLFYNDELVCTRNGIEMKNDNSETYKIPIGKRLYVIEDIDASSSVAKRSEQSGSGISGVTGVNDMLHGLGLQGNPDPVGISGFGGKGTSIGGSSAMDVTQEDADDEEIDLTTLLNILDGTLETPERMIVVTTNFPEKLDHALIRPGRIDMFVEFKKASKQIVKEMYESFYSCQMDPDDIQEIDDYKWTPAEVNQILFQCFTSKESAIKVLVEKKPEELFKYSYVNDS